MTKHGEARRHKRSREYNIWAGIISRCENPNVKAYPRYGGRGIRVCTRWRDSFPLFVYDMGRCPDGLTIERIKLHLGYSPENCRWATYREQNNNRKDNRRWTFKGETLTMAEWARKLGIKYGTIENRFYMGWPVRRILTEPVNVLWRNKRAR